MTDLSDEAMRRWLDDRIAELDRNDLSAIVANLHAFHRTMGSAFAAYPHDRRYVLECRIAMASEAIRHYGDTDGARRSLVWAKELLNDPHPD